MNDWDLRLNRSSIGKRVDQRSIGGSGRPRGEPYVFPILTLTHSLSVPILESLASRLE